MKKAIRFLTIFICLATVLCAIPQGVYAEIADALTGKSAECVDSEVVNNEIYVLGEIADLRTETSKTFRMSDGSYVLTDYAQAVHYQDERDVWLDYDNTLVSSAATADGGDFSGIENTSSNVRVKFANNSNSSNLVKISFGDYKISLHLVDAVKSKAAEIQQPIGDVEQDGSIDQAATLGKFTSGVVYRDILSDTDLEYRLSGGSVKENVIVKERQEKYSYTFELKLHGLVPVVTEKGDIALNDEQTDETILTIPAGYMYDANGEASDAVAYSVASQNGQKYTLTVTADAEWINADERAFPVTIDPSVEAFQGIKTTGDTYISKDAPSKNYYLEKKMAVGYYNSSAEQNALLEPLALPSLPASATVTSATMRLFQTDASGTYVILAASAIQSDWDSTKVTWNTKPSYSEEILDYQMLRPDTVGMWINWDITRLVQDWYSGVAACGGVALYPISGEAGAYVHFASSEYGEGQRPMLIVSYHDTKGLEGIWQYAVQSAGSAGTSYVNGFNGSLVFVHDDMTTQGSILPIAVNHVYNQYQMREEFSNTMKVGKGWKLSVQETVRTEILGGDTWFVYTDADGTDLYFYRENVNNYVSEDGYGLTLSAGTSPCITDDYGNTKKFNSSGNIMEIRDVLGNKKTFVYNSSNQLTSIAYTPASYSTATTQLTFSYNTSGALYRITNAYDTTDYVSFYYSATYNGAFSTSYSGYLRQIKYSKGGSCTYKYESDGSLSEAHDEDALKYMRYNYNRTSYTDASGEKRTIQRVSSVAEFAIHAEYGALNGQFVRFLYGNKKFTVCSRGRDDVANSGDDIYTTYLFDNYGRTICSYSTDETQTEVYGAAYAAYTATTQGSKQNNKITVDSVKGLTAANLLLNGNAESTTNWSGAISGSGYSSAYSDTDKFFGNGSFRFTATASATSAGYARRYQTVTVPSAGTYTLSAYVKTSNVKSLTANGGAYLILDGAESEKLTGTTNTAIQNGWQRISVTKTFASSGSYTVQMRLSGATGTAYFDCIQLEKSEVPSSYNLVENSDMSLSSGWSSQTTTSDSWRGKILRVEGNMKTVKHIWQTIPLNVPKNTTLMLSGWGKASAAPNGFNSVGNYRTFSIIAHVTYANGTWENRRAEFNSDYADWQYSAVAIVPEKDVKSIVVYLEYDYNLGMAYFDDICLTVEPAQTYTYDEKTGNLNTLIDKNSQKTEMAYAANGVDLATFKNVVGELYDYTYKKVNNTDTHLVSKITKTVTGNTQTLEYGYDAYGNVTSSKLTASGTPEQVKSTATYKDYGNYLSSVTDSLGHTTSYSYINDLLSYVTDANQNRTAYKYDSRKRTTTIYLDSDKDGTVDSGEAAVYYTYLQNRLSGISTATTSYTLTYDMYGNVETIKAGGNTLASYDYVGENGKLASMTLGNGDVEAYSYDILDRLVEVKYNGSITYKLTYDANGRLYRCVDSKSGITHQYEYDSLGRLIRAWQKKTSTGETILAVENTYDVYGRAKGSKYVVDGKTKGQSVSYKKDSNLVSSVDWSHLGSTPGFSYTYDAFDRLISKHMTSGYSAHIDTDYTYKTRTSGGITYTSSLISEEKLRAGSKTTTYAYTYDALGNITVIDKDGMLHRIYTYDSLNRLVEEYDAEARVSYSYTYDNAGNILSKSKNGVKTTYKYSTSAWGDLLTNYNGMTISYDKIGNPLNWRNMQDIQWNGRQLKSFTTDAGTRGVQFSYNADGIRTYKSHYNHGDLNMYHIDYVLDGTKILKETYTHTVTGRTYTLYYFYDEKGDVAGFEYNGNAYFYQKNIQGDILRVCNEGGDIVAEYTYDTWGKVLSVTDAKGNAITDETHVANLNPFRYRSYYYDSETGFYYLNSRYYDPEVGRFLNADGIIGANGGITGYNMFAYCNNNPVIHYDPSGNASAICLGDRSSLGFRDPWRDAGGAGGVSARSSVGIRPNSKGELEFEESLYDSNRSKTHPSAFRERAIGISGSVLALTMDDDKRFNFTLADLEAYGYKAGYYFEYFELEGIAGDASIDSSIGSNGLNVSALASIASGSATIQLGSISIRFEGYVGGAGFDACFSFGKKIGFSALDIVGGGVYLVWD